METKHVAPADLIASYRRDGYAVCHDVLDAEAVDALREEEARLWREAATNLERPDVYWRRHQTLGRVADRIDPATAVSRLFAELAEDRRLLDLADAFLGTSAVLYKEKLISKSPGTAGYALHHDFAYWAHLGVPAEAFVTLFVALDAANGTTGAVEVYPGLHSRNLPPHPDDPYDIDPAGVEGSASVTPELRAGDVLAFHSKIPHRSGSNRGSTPRRAFIVTYVDTRYREMAQPMDLERRKIVYRALARDNV
jgi:ectoine hydroxylase-related dioxygenase (phytanoyl-CoA dioxygenase family)